MNKAKTALFAAVGLCVFALGAGGGAFYYYQKTSPELSKAKVAIESLGAFRNKVIGSITAFGQVQSISGRIITLKQGQDALAIRVRDDAEVIFYSNSARTSASFDNIKKDDILNIEISILPDNQLEGRAVIIFPDLKK